MQTSTIDQIAAQCRADSCGVFVGRFCPIHLGHQPIVESLLTLFPERHVIYIDECGDRSSLRNPFSYEDRAEFVRALFPEARLARLAELDKRDRAWVLRLDEIVWAQGLDPVKSVYLSGSREDAERCCDSGRPLCLVNRYTSPHAHVSGRHVRDALVEGRSLEGLVDERIIPLVEDRFRLRWEQIKNL